MAANLVNRRRQAAAHTRRPPQAKPKDRELADLEGWIEKAKDLPDLRWEKVKAVREALARGEYDLDARLESLLSRSPAEWGGQPAGE